MRYLILKGFKSLVESQVIDFTRFNTYALKIIYNLLILLKKKIHNFSRIPNYLILLGKIKRPLKSNLLDLTRNQGVTRL